MTPLVLLSLPAVAGVVVAMEAPSPGFDYIGPIAGSGIVGIFLLLVIFRIKIMPTYVHDDFKKECQREREERDKDIEELKQSLREANSVYTTQVIPTLTRVLDAERELVDLRRDEQVSRRRAAEADRDLSAYRRDEARRGREADEP